MRSIPVEEPSIPPSLILIPPTPSEYPQVDYPPAHSELLKLVIPPVIAPEEMEQGGDASISVIQVEAEWVIEIDESGNG